MNKHEEENRSRLIKILKKIVRSSNIDGWQCLGITAIGGLCAIGFSKQHELLLIESSQGRGLFDCKSGKIISRDKDDTFSNENEKELRCLGIGILENELVEMAGIYGGALLKQTSRGESIEIVAPNWPLYNIVFCSSFSSPFFETSVDKCKIIASEYEIRACGFSSDEKYFVYATSSDFTLYKRIE